MFFVNNRWLGGMLTNFSTIKNSLLRLKKLEKMEIDGTFQNMTKKEVANLMKERTQLEKNLGGIKEMKELPGIIFIIDTRKEAIAVTEARRVGIPIAAVVDTNCNPEGITFPIPGNDDAIRAINLFAQIIANAVIEAENEAGLVVVDTLQEEKGEEQFAEAIDKGEFAAQSKYDKEEEVEKVAVAAVLGAAADESATGFTDKDYSNYNPDEAARKEDAPATEEHEIDEDKLYKE
jgi:small subunit ribosomal protein S2